MRTPLLLLALISLLVFSSCTTAYKTGQTPDDVYFSPARPENEYVAVEKKDNRRYQATEEYYDDRYLRMKVRDRYRWSELDDWYYYGNRYSYTYFPSIGFYSNPWTPYTYWNCNYNPYYNKGVIIGTPTRATVYSRPRVFNLNTYNSNALTNSNYSKPAKPGITNNNSRNVNTYSNSSSNSNSSGSVLRNIFNNNNNSGSSGTKSSPSTSSSSNNNSNSSSSGTKSSSAPVRKF